MRLADDVAAMRGGGPIHRRRHQTLQPVPDPVSSQGLHPDRQQTLRASVRKAVPRRVFSQSPVSTFLSIVSRYQASVRHVSGSAILPSDFASRNAAPCEDEACQVCTFTKLAQDSDASSDAHRYKTY